MELDKTHRGFSLVEFKDHNNYKCSLQKSSLIGEDCIWLGMDKPSIKEFFPFPRETDESWFDISEVDLQILKKRPQNIIHSFSRMHLTRDQVKELLPLLQKFVDTGELE